jgi:hypothetical protein
MNDNLKKLSESCLFVRCPDAEKCPRNCPNKYLIRVRTSRAKILCGYNFVEKEPLFYQIDKGANHEN